MSISIFAEGGGNRGLNKKCRKALTSFLERAGVKPRSFSIEPSGSCSNALKDFSLSLEDKSGSILLVDSEEPFCDKTKWGHLSKRKDSKLKRPRGATERHIYLMEECMGVMVLGGQRGFE